MSLSLEMTVLRPTSWTLFEEDLKTKRGTTTVWEPFMYLGGNVSWHGTPPRRHERAELCMLSALYSELIEACKKPSVRLFTPPFIMPEELDQEQMHVSPRQWLRDRCVTHPLRKPVTMPWWNYTGVSSYGYPYHGDRKRHNSFWELPAPERRAALKEASRSGILRGGVLIWIPCEEVAGWLRKLEEGKGAGRTSSLLHQDREALAIVKGRRAHLEELAPFNYRIMFACESGDALPRSPFF